MRLVLLHLLRTRRDDWAAVLIMADWQPAAGAAADLPLLVSVLQAAAGASSNGSTLKALLEKLPLSGQLQRSDWLEILRVRLQRECFGHPPLLPWALGLQPELRDMSMGQLAPLLEAAVQSDSAQEAAVLTALPAAQQLQPEDVERMLTGARVKHKSDVLQVVAALPAAQQLSALALARVLRAAVQLWGCMPWHGMQVLLQLPAAQQLDAAALGELLAVAADRGELALRALASLPAAQQLQPDVLFGVLQQLVRQLACLRSATYCVSGRIFGPLLQLQPAQQIPLVSLQQLFDAVTDLGPLGRTVLGLIRKLPQAAGLQQRLPLKRLLLLLAQACEIPERYSLQEGMPVDGVELLQ